MNEWMHKQPQGHIATRDPNLPQGHIAGTQIQLSGLMLVPFQSAAQGFRRCGYPVALLSPDEETIATSSLSQSLGNHQPKQDHF